MKVHRRLVMWIIPAGLLAAIVAIPVAAWSSLPDPMASHWGWSGAPNGALPRLGLVGLNAGIFIVMWAAVARLAHHAPREAAGLRAGLYFTGGLLAGLQWFIVAANRGVGDWRQAKSSSLSTIVVVVAVAIASGWIGWRLSGGSPPRERHPAVPLPRIDIADPQNVVWSDRVGSHWLTLLGVASLIAAAAVWSAASWVLGSIGLVILVFSAVRVTVGSSGVQISMGWLGIPWQRVDLRTIEHAEVEMVEPMSYGGWGYRVRPGVRAIVVRRGPAIRLVRIDKADLVITVDDAAAGAGLVNGLIGVGPH